MNSQTRLLVVMVAWHFAFNNGVVAGDRHVYALEQLKLATH